jgi:Holliday junction resolvase RusA-like endonuclease
VGRRSRTQSSTWTTVGTHRITLPLPPSVNRLWRVDQKTRRPYADPKAAAWKSDAFILMRAANIGPYPHGDYRFILEGTLYCDERRDLDNCFKYTLDALSQALNIDDRYVRRIVCDKVSTPTRKKHRIEIAVTVERGEE